MLLSDFDFFKQCRWRAIVVDEAHALKNKESQLQRALSELDYDHLLLLTGTPLQNDVAELWALLNLVQPERFSSPQAFYHAYGELKTAEEVALLQKDLAPIMLRRQKEDVEKSIPPKEETIINVELTRLQKAYYRAIFERNRAFLTRGVSNAGAGAGGGGGGGGQQVSLINIEMELRKCCNHPFLMRGVEMRESSTLGGGRKERGRVWRGDWGGADAQLVGARACQLLRASA